MSKRTPEEWTVSWRRLGGTENSVGTPACRSHPLRRVLEAYLQETEAPLHDALRCRRQVPPEALPPQVLGFP